MVNIIMGIKNTEFNLKNDRLAVMEMPQNILWRRNC